jgi:hypothetical protein
VRARLDGLGLFYGIGGALAVFGVLALLLVMQSPSWAQWTGIKVHGVTSQQQTQYDYHGELYTISNTSAPLDHKSRPTTVWLSRGDPTDSSKAYIDSAANRWLDFSMVMIWFVAAITVVVAGIVRRLRRW